MGKSPDGAPALGFFEAESNRLVPIDACPILSPRLNALLAVLRSEPWISALANGREVELLADDRDEKVMLTLAGNWNAQEAETLAHKCLAELDGRRDRCLRAGGGRAGFRRAASHLSGGRVCLSRQPDVLLPKRALSSPSSWPQLQRR